MFCNNIRYFVNLRRKCLAQHWSGEAESGLPMHVNKEVIIRERKSKAFIMPQII